MAASPEVSRLNGAKSRGPVTLKGKAIASRNATKHGIMSSHPPLLLMEDLETFQGMMQALIDEYQPQTPTEHLLIQQVSMAWLRLHRLWGVEAARANIEILKAQARAKYPAYAEPEKLSALLDYEPKSWALAMREERQVFETLIVNLTYDLSRCPNKPAQYVKWIREVDESMYRVKPGSIDATEREL